MRNKNFKKNKNIEIEFRSIFDENRYVELKEFLDKNAQNLGEDDKDVFFFIMPDKLIKVVNNISRNNAKLVLKLNKIGKGSDFKEIEIPISQADVDDAVKIFSALEITDNVMQSFQKRRNYLYKDVELALKYSDVWGYHLELEILINDLNEKQSAEQKIMGIVDELGIKLMTDEELTEFTKNAEEKYKKQNKK
jgi:adenylate cyclase class IV